MSTIAVASRSGFSPLLSAIDIVDAHQHVWSLSNPFHSWPDAELGGLYCDYGMQDWAAVAHSAGVTRSVLVQAQEDWRETLWMLSLAARHPTIAGVVGWIDLTHTEAPERIAWLAGQPGLKGVRPMLQDMEDEDWLLSPELRPALKALCRHGLRLDALIRPRHLDMLCRFRRAWPELPLVIDHGAKPDMTGGGFSFWRDAMARLSDLGVACKFSGLQTELPSGGDEMLLAPFVETLLTLFPERLLWGSDWPVCLLTGKTYGDTLDFARNSVSHFARDRAESIFSDASVAFYGLDRTAISSAD
ncbi:amidohydrolase family protein [Asaia sp. BMEF1]|uniref:amidohydrolase family protein n=1 Tax=Asaia sp. BMEF1 TaxID=3155932 RepID=UPI003F67E989